MLLDNFTTLYFGLFYSLIIRRKKNSAIYFFILCPPAAAAAQIPLLGRNIMKPQNKTECLNGDAGEKTSNHTDLVRGCKKVLKAQRVYFSLFGSLYEVSWTAVSSMAPAGGSSCHCGPAQPGAGELAHQHIHCNCVPWVGRCQKDSIDVSDLSFNLQVWFASSQNTDIEPVKPKHQPHSSQSEFLQVSTMHV